MSPSILNQPVGKGLLQMGQDLVQTKNYGQVRSSLLPLNSTPLSTQVSDLSVQFLQVNGPNHIGELTPKDRTGEGTQLCSVHHL